MLHLLDRAIVNDECMSFFSSVSCMTLPRSQPDHFPIILSLSKGVKSKPSPFKFFSMWNEHSDYARLVKEVWSKQVIGCPMSIFMKKLKMLKSELKLWNKEVFGNVQVLVDKAMTDVDEVQQKIICDGMTDDLYSQELKAQMELQKILFIEESFWKQKSSLNWFSKGDRNTAYFYKVARVRQSTKQISMLKEG